MADKAKDAEERLRSEELKGAQQDGGWTLALAMLLIVALANTISLSPSMCVYVCACRMPQMAVSQLQAIGLLLFPTVSLLAQALSVCGR